MIDHPFSLLCDLAVFLFSSAFILSFLYMGFPCRDDSDKKESLIPVIEESRDSRNRRGMMDACQNGVECSTEFWPIEHPIEPRDEDQPVKCPVPDSSLINDGRMQEEQFSDSQRKRTEPSPGMNKEEMVVLAVEPPARAVRKRHHTSPTQQELTPVQGMPPPHPRPTQNITIFQTLQQFNKFES